MAAASRKLDVHFLFQLQLDAMAVLLRSRHLHDGWRKTTGGVCGVQVVFMGCKGFYLHHGQIHLVAGPYFWTIQLAKFGVSSNRARTKVVIPSWQAASRRGQGEEIKEMFSAALAAASVRDACTHTMQALQQQATDHLGLVRGT